ncbi:MAG: hypothetical protein CMM50_00535 [Rhodospirillaceae bacterium]|nr:hypothetical protein [Rhodospirillaceae bacterium]
MVDGSGGTLSALLAQSRPQAGGSIDGTVGQPKSASPQRTESQEGPDRVPPAPRGAGRGRLLDIIV